jgi:flagellar FliL protein
MKRMMIFIVIGLMLFGAGIGGGIIWGRKSNNYDDGSGEKKIAAPGPVVSIGEFTVNLAGAGGNRILSFSVSLEALNAKTGDMIKSQNWLPRIRNEILLVGKDKIYEDLTKAEGVIQFGEQIKKTLNTILPHTRGEVPIVRVMFESFVLQ